MARRLHVGDTPRMRMTATKDGTTWDVTGATITFYLKDPDGNVESFAGTIETAASGTFYRDLATTVLDEEGRWAKRFKVEQSGVVAHSDWEEFPVEE